MCYAGCRYELTWGENAGECSLPSGEKPPIDAMCVINDLGAENEKLRELVSDMMRFFEDGDYCTICEKVADCDKAQDVYDVDCLMRGVFHNRMKELGIEVHHDD